MTASNHQPHDCFLNRLFRHRSKKTSKLRVTGLCVGNSPGPVNSPHKWPVTRKMFPFDDVIIITFFSPFGMETLSAFLVADKIIPLSKSQYLSTWALKLIHVGKRGPSSFHHSTSPLSTYVLLLSHTVQINLGMVPVMIFVSGIAFQHTTLHCDVLGRISQVAVMLQFRRAEHLIPA